MTCYYQERTTQYTMSRHKMEESAGFAFEASHFSRFWAKLELKEMLYVNNMVKVVGIINIHPCRNNCFNANKIFPFHVGA